MPMVQTVSDSTVLGSAQEQRGLNFFRERTSRQLSGFYECDFWNCSVLQASHSDSSIRHALVALASLHEDFEKTGDAEQTRNNFALKQYNLAIREHLDSLVPHETRSVDNYVASCMIFISIEAIQGHYNSALSLVSRAVKLFYEQNDGHYRSSAWPVLTLEDMLSRLQAQAVGLVGLSGFPEPMPPRVKTLRTPVIPEDSHLFKKLGTASNSTLTLVPYLVERQECVVQSS